MKTLTIVSGAANPVGNAIALNALTKTWSENLVLALSRKGTNVDGATNLRFTDLRDRDEVRHSLFRVLTNIKESSLEKIDFIHTTSESKFDFRNFEKENPYWKESFPEARQQRKLTISDHDGDGIDDDGYTASIVPYRNISDRLLEYYPTTKTTQVVFGAQLDKKYPEISEVLNSMVKIDKILSKELQDKVTKNSHVQGINILPSTIATHSEVNFRPYSIDKQFRLPSIKVANLVSTKLCEERKNTFEFVDCIEYNPRYSLYFQHETPEQE